MAKQTITHGSMLEASVIIPVWNNADGLRQTLASLERQTLSADRFEVLVVDNASHPPLELTSDALNVRLMHEPCPGSYRARNLTLQHARGAVLAFTDADCIAEPQWLAAALAAVETHGEAAFIAGEIVVFGHAGDSLGPVQAYETVACFNQRAAIRNVGCGATANLIIPRKLMEAVGPFDEILSGGDYLWCKRAIAHGAQPVFCAEARVRHPTRGKRRAVLAREGRLVGGHRDVMPGAWACLRYVARHLLPPRQNILEILRLPAERITATDRLAAVLFALQARWHMAWTRLKLELTHGASAR